MARNDKNNDDRRSRRKAPPRGDAPLRAKGPKGPRKDHGPQEELGSKKDFGAKKGFGATKRFGTRTDDGAREGGRRDVAKKDFDRRPGDRPAGPTRGRDDRGFRGDRQIGDRPPRSDKPFRPDRSRSGAKPLRRDKPLKTRVPRPDQAAQPIAAAKDADRVAKVIARAGLGSRREAEEWIAAGRVAVNGAVITSPALNVTARDRITVDGRPLPERERTRLFLYHKPAGLMTTTSDPEGRPTIFGALPAGLPRLVTVGRLDFNSEGLLLLTNDGGLARVLELPDTGWLRRYRVRAHGTVTQDRLDTLEEGVVVDAIHYGPIDATLERQQGANVWIAVALREGKNREVRNVLGSLGLDVNRLIRVSYGPFQLGDLAEGAVAEIDTEVLIEQLGERIATAAGADFTAPLFDHAAEEAPRRPARDNRAARRGRDDGRARPPRSGDERAARGRDERPGREPNQAIVRGSNVWRAAEMTPGEAPVKRKFHGTRRGEPIAAETEPAPIRRAGAVQDRKGRRILVERRQSELPEAPPERPEKRFDRPRGERSFDKPRGERSFDKPRGERSFGKPRGERSFDKPRGERSFDKPRGERSFDKPRGERSFDKPRGERSFDKPRGERSFGKPRGERSFDKPRGERSFDKPRGERSFDKPRGERSFDKPRGERSFDKPRGERSFDKPRGERSFDKPRGERPRSGKPSFGKPRGDRPGGGRPSGDKPRGPRPPRGR